MQTPTWPSSNPSIVACDMEDQDEDEIGYAGESLI